MGCLRTNSLIFKKLKANIKVIKLNIQTEPRGKSKQNNHQKNSSPESPVELLLRCAAGGDVDGQEEFLEVDETVLVTVEGPEDVLTELSGAAQQLFWVNYLPINYQGCPKYQNCPHYNNYNF